MVAESFELAREAAGLVKVDYEAAPHETRLAEVEAEAHEPARGKKGYTPPPKPRGRADEALAAAPVRVEATYEHPPLHHNPMEPHATTVIVEADGSLTIHDKTQGVTNSRDYVCKVFGLASDQVRVVTPFVGGGFGSGLRPQYRVFLAVLAARELRRSVRVVLSRQQMFTIGYRPWTRQRVALGAERDGRLRALIHEAVGNTSRFEDYCENVVPWSGVLYECPNTRLEYGVAALDLYTPIDARAPGAVTGLWALESAIDELAGRAGHRPAGAAAQELRRGGSGPPAPALEQGPARLLPRGRGAVRLAPALPGRAIDAGGRAADRLGHGHRHLGGAAGPRRPRRC